jgi:hypothetical protein
MSTSSMTGLQDAVHEHFAHLYENLAGTQLVLGFEPIGISIVDLDYRGPDGAYDAEKCKERTSALVDHTMHVHAATATRTPLAASALEEFILSGQAGDGANEEQLGLFEKVKAKAKQTYEAVTYPALLTGIEFAPVMATPDQWFDSTNPAWQEFSQTVDETPSDSLPAADSTSTIAPWSLQVLPPENRGIIERVATLAPQVREVDAEPVVGVPAVALDTTSFLTERSHLAVHRLADSPLHLAVAPSSVEVVGTIERRLDVLPTVQTEPISEHLTTLLSLDRARLSSVEIDNTLLLRQVATTATPKPLLGTHVSIDFWSQLVTIDRPWWSSALLAMDDWYIPSFAEGAFSDGNVEDNAGQTPALPVAFIAVHSLTLSGSWSQEDQAALPDAVSFGPFSLVGRTITRTDETLQIVVPGIQIVAWICSILPVLPPAADPHTRDVSARPVVTP